MHHTENAMSIPPIQIVRWANAENNGLSVDSGERPIQMAHSDGTGLPLVKLDKFGADVIRFAPGKGIMSHTHMGDSIVFVISGQGTIEYDGKEHTLTPGVCFLIPSMAQHAIRATSELIIIVVGNNHVALDDKNVLHTSPDHMAAQKPRGCCG